MEIRPTLPPMASPSTPQIQQLVSSWRAGQVLDGTVVDKPSSNTILVKIGEALLLGKGADLPELAKGALVKLEVLMAGNAPALKLLAPATAASGATPAATGATATAEPLREWLPRQSPLAPLLANLAAATIPSSAVPPLPKAVADAVRHFLATLPSIKNVTQARTLAQSVADSGAFLENKLRQAIDKPPTATPTLPPLKHDLKNALLQLASALEKAQPKPAASTTANPTITRTATTPPAGVATPTLTRSESQGRPVEAPRTLVDKPDAAASVASEARASAATESRSSAATTPPSSRALADLPPPLKGAPLVAQPRVAPDLPATPSLPLLLRDLREQVDGAVARMTATQLTHTSNTETNPPWHVTCELPIRRDAQQFDVLGLRITEESAREQDAAKRRFSVTLSFDFPETGAFYAHVRVMDKFVSCSFQAEQGATAAKVTQELSRLSAELTRAGLQVGDLSAQQGAPLGMMRRPGMAPLVDTSV